MSHPVALDRRRLCRIRLERLKEDPHLGSVMRRISLAKRPMKFTLSSTGAKRGIGMAVD